MKVNIFVVILLCIALFAAGLISSPYISSFVDSRRPDSSTAEEVAAEPQQPEFRVYDGEFQWRDGSRWHSAGDAQQLIVSDPFAPIDLMTGEPAAPTGLGRGTGSVPRYSGGSSSSGSSGSAPAASGGGGAPAPDPGSSSGDGQNIEWSNDFL